jgi:hypothetical protein
MAQAMPLAMATGDSYHATSQSAPPLAKPVEHRLDDTGNKTGDKTGDFSEGENPVVPNPVVQTTTTANAQASLAPHPNVSPHQNPVAAPLATPVTASIKAPIKTQTGSAETTPYPNTTPATSSASSATPSSATPAAMPVTSVGLSGSNATAIPAPSTTQIADKPQSDNLETKPDKPTLILTQAQLLDLVTSPKVLTDEPLTPARSFHINPDGTIWDTANNRLWPPLPAAEQNALNAKKSPKAWAKLHWPVLVGAALGGLTGLKFFMLLKPLDLKRLVWTAHTPWALPTELLNGVVQPVLQGIRENPLLNNSIHWLKLTLSSTPIIFGVLWGNRQQQQWQKKQTTAKVKPLNE